MGAGRVIVEAFVDFDYEITLLTIRHAGGTSFCAPIGHLQDDGDYRESWQPHAMAPATLDAARDAGAAVTDALGGTGIFGVELFVRGDEVLFSEVSPRPHDTGMTTMATQGLSEFALHVRAILGLPVPAGEVPLLSAGRLGRVPGDRPRRRADDRRASPRRWPSTPASTCACSPSPMPGPTAAWPSRWPAAPTRPPRARPRAPRRRACASNRQFA